MPLDQEDCEEMHEEEQVGEGRDLDHHCYDTRLCGAGQVLLLKGGVYWDLPVTTTDLVREDDSYRKNLPSSTTCLNNNNQLLTEQLLIQFEETRIVSLH